MEALKELYRISKKYIFLVEPCYEIANDESELSVEKLGYIRRLKGKILNLGYNLVLEKMSENDINNLNLAKIYVIEKKSNDKNPANLCCPITKSKLSMIDNCYYSKGSFLVYPIIGDIPCLLSENAVIATKFLEFEK